jgi:amidase
MVGVGSWNGAEGSRRDFLQKSAIGLTGLLALPLASANSGIMPAPDPLLFKSATELLQLIRSKTISSQELVKAHLDRIRAVNPALNAVCQIDEAGALKAAREADDALARGAPLGPLHGLPITIKDSFDTKGIITTGGTTGRAKLIPAKDATAVARLRAAGAIILGKTNTPELTISYETDNLIYGRTNNPYDLTRTPGGSSGGAAAILAAGGSALDLGSDTAGSIRVPAHFCGIAGLKPTFGRVSRAGHIIPPGGVVGRQTHVGPMARSAQDLALALSVIGGLDPEDPDVVPVVPADPAKVEIKSLRIAYFEQHGDETISPAIRQTVQEVIAAFRTDGIQCTQALPEGFDAAREILNTLNSGDGGDYYRQLLRRCGTTNLHSATANFLQTARNGVVSGRKYSDVLMDWAALRESASKFMMSFDLLICPPCSGTAPKHGESGSLDFANAYFFNLLGWPAAVVRAGKTADGLPVGIQIIGKPWREDQVLALALRIENTTGGYKPDFPEQPLHSAGGAGS